MYLSTSESKSIYSSYRLPVPGSTPSAAKIVDADGRDVTGNYSIKYADGALTVEARMGDIKTGVKEEEGVPGMAVTGLTDELARDIMTSEEQAQQAAGKTVLLYLDVANIDGRVSEGELNMILAAAQGKTVDGEAKIGVCLDIDLRLKVGEGKPRHITDTGKPVILIIAIPENLRKEGRVFFLVRVHDGAAEVIAQSTGDSLEASSSLFSTYAIAYVDDEDAQAHCKADEGAQADGEAYCEAHGQANREAHAQANRKAHGKARAEARCVGLYAAGPHDRVEL